MWGGPAQVSASRYERSTEENILSLFIQCSLHLAQANTDKPLPLRSSQSIGQHIIQSILIFSVSQGHDTCIYMAP